MKLKKSIIFVYITILMGIILQGCSNDDVTIIEHSDLNVRVATQPVYDGFDATKSIKERLLNDGYSIGVTVFVYGEDGNLIAEKTQSSAVFGNMSFGFERIPNGKYTLVVVECLVDNETGVSEDWDIIGTDKLSNLEIQSKDGLHYWYSAIGVSTKEIELKGSADVDLIPEGIGCIVNLYAFNFVNSDYAVIGFYTKDEPIGRYLSPQYKGDSRFHDQEYNAERTWSTRGYIWVEDEIESMDVYLLESGRINCCIGPLKRNDSGGISSNFTAYPSNTFYLDTEDFGYYYGGINYKGTNNCEAAFFNTFDELANWYRNLDNSDEPTPNTTFVQPYLNWRGSPTDVISYMSSNGFNNPIHDSDETSEDYMFIGLSSTYLYTFDLANNALDWILVEFDEDYYTLESVLNLMGKKFTDMGYSSEIGMYLFYDSQTIVSVFEVEGTVMAMYMENTVLDSAPKKIKGLQNMVSNRMLEKKNSYLRKKGMRRVSPFSVKNLFGK